MNCIAMLAAAAATLLAGAAQAAELRAGAIIHDAFGIDGGVSGKEKSGGLTLNFVSDPLGERGILGATRFELGGDLNLGGKTNLAYGGLLWRGRFGAQRRFYAEFSVGLGVHDGYNEIANLEPGLTPDEAQRRIFLNAHYIEYGSDILFREAITLGYRFTDDWAADAFYEHFSHGKILSNGSNEGLDTVGLRISRRLN